MLNGHIAHEPGALNQPNPAIHKEWCPTCGHPLGVRVTMKDLAVFVCEKHGITLAELKSDRRSKRIAYPRHEFMALAYELPHVTYPMIASFLHKDHSSCIYGRREHIKRLAEQVSPTP